MFENVGQKIKTLAVVLFWGTTILSALASLAIAISTSNGAYLLLAIGGVISAYVISLLVYGFGELVENSYLTASSSAKAYRNTGVIITEIKSLKEPNNDPQSNRF